MDDALYRPFNFPAFRKMLTEALRKAFLQFQDEHPDERVYAFILVLYESCRLSLRVNSEEALVREAQRQTTRDSIPFDIKRVSLRWSCDDWEYKAYAHETIRYAAGMLSEYAWVVTEDTNGVPHYEPYEGVALDQVCLACLEALTDLNKERIFGVGAEREAITLGLWLHGQSQEDRLRWTRMLNPEATCVRLEAELAAGLEAFHAGSVFYRAKRTSEERWPSL